MINEIKQDATSRMLKSIEVLKGEFSKIRTGRAHTSLLDHLRVDFYGNEVPINQAANVSVQDARTLSVQPWDRTMVPVIEKAIMNSNLGLNPVTSGDNIRVPLPPLTEERRKDMIRIVRQESENGRVAIRNIRRDAISDLKELQKEKEITEDELHRAEDDIQKITDKHVGEMDALLGLKEKDLMEI